MTKRILIVDDEADICQVVQASLEEFGGWQTFLAHSGAEGLTVAQAKRPDAILLDVSMPVMDGFQMFEHLRENPDLQDIPVILLTSKVLARDRKRFADLSIAGVITKPFNPLTIWQQVASLLSW
ncbi:response regulator [Leptolyngbya iicbica]|uniref:Response regulator n=2 Tax=Cyanophyceae TaxID=3028117 RepID=A0A4Q7EAC8_9CYAN|nr:response regulator [Leptolyngbya sp. LK]RZM79414.1 response regulator [Leptolyngbya sp. LK]